MSDQNNKIKSYSKPSIERLAEEDLIASVSFMEKHYRQKIIFKLTVASIVSFSSIISYFVTLINRAGI